MISQFGILKKDEAGDLFPDIWERYQGEHEWDESKLERAHKVNIKLIGCWDTVGSLGIPETRYTKYVTKLFHLNREHAFHDTKLSDGKPLPHLFVSLLTPAYSGRERFPCAILGRHSYDFQAHTLVHPTGRG